MCHSSGRLQPHPFSQFSGSPNSPITRYQRPENSPEPSQSVDSDSWFTKDLGCMQLARVARSRGTFIDTNKQPERLFSIYPLDFRKLFVPIEQYTCQRCYKLLQKAQRSSNKPRQKCLEMAQTRQVHLQGNRVHRNKVPVPTQSNFLQPQKCLEGVR